jgi:hypothetical protein
MPENQDPIEEKPKSYFRKSKNSLPMKTSIQIQWNHSISDERLHNKVMLHN